MDATNKTRLIRVGAIVGILIIVALVIVAISQINWPKKTTTEEDITTVIVEHNQTTGNITQPVCDDLCKLQYGQTNMSYCGLIENSTFKVACYSVWVNESLDACLLQPAEKKETCIYYHAKKTGNLSLCNLAANVTACELYTEPCYAYQDSKRRTCIALSKNDVAQCKDDDDCRYNYSITKNDVSACSKIIMNSKRTACESILEKKDHCGDLNVQAEQDLCWQLYATTTNDKNVCYGISSLSNYALECFSYFAAKNHDVGFCKQGGFELDELWQCYRNYSLITGDLQGCFRLQNESLDLATTNIFYCYFDVAKKYGNPHACDYINQLGSRSTCYEGSVLGNTNLNYTYCADVVSEKWKNKCYIEYAKLNNDPSVCNYILTPNEKEACTIAWQVYTNQTGTS